MILQVLADAGLRVVRIDAVLRQPCRIAEHFVVSMFRFNDTIVSLKWN